MIIKKVHLSNIRSYVDQEIELESGITLFEGDIGSGKTTILMAIDFALFGNSTREFYERLLRKGATKGYVEVVFEHDGEEYLIHRALEKNGGRIVNTESYVITPEGKIKLTATQVRNYVLSLMGVEVEKGRRKALPLVKYAIYTPQETMKEILEGGDEERMDVIRRIFKLDEYKNASENARNVSRNLRADGAVSRSKEEEITRLEGEIGRKEEELKSLRAEVENLRSELAMRENAYRVKEKEWKEINELRKKYETLRLEIRSGEVRLKSLKEELERERKEIENIESMKLKLKQLEKEAREYEEIEKKRNNVQERFNKLKEEEVRYRSSLERIKSLKEKIDKTLRKKDKLEELAKREKELSKEVSKLSSLEDEKRKLEEKRSAIIGKMQAIDSKIRELEREIDEISSLEGICPKCKRPLTEEHKNKLISETRENIEKLKRELADVAKSKASAERKLREIGEEIDDLRKLQREVAALRERIRILTEEIEEGENARRILEEEQRELPKFDENELKNVAQELENLTERTRLLRDVWSEYTSLRKGVEREEMVRKRILEIENEISTVDAEVDKLRKSLNALKYSEEVYSKIESKYTETGKALSFLRARLREKESRLKELEDEIDEKKALIEKLRSEAEVFRKRGEFGDWLRSEFAEAMEEIENMRLLAINEEFRSLFEEWFYELLGESEYEAWVDEKFRPIIRYQKFDMPLSTLSGGERTSVALAYRLALNTMVKRALGLSSNILILDEPTDGFSKDQLYKLKDVFEKMETDQVIIVSHEKELMNLADTVYHVEKVNGISHIRKISG